MSVLDMSSSANSTHWASAVRVSRHRLGLRLSDRRVLLGLGDALVSIAASIIALGLWTVTSGEQFSLAYLRAHGLWLVGLPLAWLLANINLLSLREAASWPDTARGLARAAAAGLVVYLAVFFFAPRDLLPRLVVLYFVVGAFLLSLAWRRIYITALVSPYFKRRALVIGAGWAGEAIISTLAEKQPHEYVVVGLIDDDPARHGAFVRGVPVLGGHATLLAAVRSLRVSEVILALSGRIEGSAFQALLECQAHGVPVVRMSSLYEQVTGRVPIEYLDANWIASSFIDRVHLSTWSYLSKRLLDVAGALLGLCVFGWLVPFIAAAIRLESRGPVFYRQCRLGTGGRSFNMIKFRTMIPDAEPDGQARWASLDDTRVTRVGRILRRARLDEIPQFWNVLRGEMSLVGPRPERPEFIADLEKIIPFYRARLLLKPGLTGWAQINYGYTASIEETLTKLQYDLYYIKHQSLWLDLLIILRTVGVILRFRGT